MTLDLGSNQDCLLISSLRRHWAIEACAQREHEALCQASGGSSTPPVILWNEPSTYPASVYTEARTESSVRAGLIQRCILNTRKVHTNFRRSSLGSGQGEVIHGILSNT